MTETEPLQPDTGICAHANLRKAMRVVSRAYDAAFRPTGLKATQFTLLVVLARHGEMPLTKLSRTLIVPTSNAAGPREDLDDLRRMLRDIDRQLEALHEELEAQQSYDPANRVRDTEGDLRRARPRVAQRRGSARTPPAAAAVRSTYSTVARVSMGGSVLGVQQTVVKPPRAAAWVPVAMVSLYSRPGSRR